MRLDEAFPKVLAALDQLLADALDNGELAGAKSLAVGRRVRGTARDLPRLLVAPTNSVRDAEATTRAEVWTLVFDVAAVARHRDEQAGLDEAMAVLLAARRVIVSGLREQLAGDARIVGDVSMPRIDPYQGEDADGPLWASAGELDVRVTVHEPPVG